MTAYIPTRAPAAGPVELEPDHPAWLDLVAASPDATVFHLPAWARVLADTYGFRTTVLADAEDGRVTAGVPVVRVRRPRGPALVSLPFSDHCPPLAADPEDPTALERLAARLAEPAARAGRPLEVRGAMPATAGWDLDEVGFRHVLRIDAGPQALRAGLRPTHRRRLREAERSGVRVRFGWGAAEMEAFHRLHVSTRRRQGVPVQPMRFFRALQRHVIGPGHGVIALAEGPAGEVIAGAVVLTWNGTAIGKFQASQAGAWALRPNHLLSWECLLWSSRSGLHRFDFGRTDAGHDGLQRWKAGWGAEAVPLVYATAGGGPRRAGQDGLAASLLGRVIRHTPAVVCRAAGALLYRYAA